MGRESLKLSGEVKSAVRTAKAVPPQCTCPFQATALAFSPEYVWPCCVRPFPTWDSQTTWSINRRKGNVSSTSLALPTTCSVHWAPGHAFTSQQICRRGSHVSVPLTLPELLFASGALPSLTENRMCHRWSFYLSSCHCSYYCWSRSESWWGQCLFHHSRHLFRTGYSYMDGKDRIKKSIGLVLLQHVIVLEHGHHQKITTTEHISALSAHKSKLGSILTPVLPSLIILPKTLWYPILFKARILRFGLHENFTSVSFPHILLCVCFLSPSYSFLTLWTSKFQKIGRHPLPHWDFLPHDQGGQLDFWFYTSWTSQYYKHSNSNTNNTQTSKMPFPHRLCAKPHV